MLVVTRKYGKVHIRFQYDSRLKNQNTDGKLSKKVEILPITKDNPIITKAFLERAVDNKKEVIKEVSIKKHPKEKNDKRLSRKFALQALVKESFDRSVDLSDRTMIWNTFKDSINY